MKANLVAEERELSDGAENKGNPAFRDRAIAGILDLPNFELPLAFVVTAPGAVDIHARVPFDADSRARSRGVQARREALSSAGKIEIKVGTFVMRPDGDVDCPVVE